MSTDRTTLTHRVSAAITAGGLGWIPGVVVAGLVGWVRGDFADFASVVLAVAAAFAMVAFVAPLFAIHLVEGLLNVAIGFLNGAARNGSEDPTSTAPLPMKMLFWVATVCGGVVFAVWYRYP